MKKTISKLLLIVLLLIPFTVNAAGNNINLDDNKTITPGGSISVELTANFDSNVKAAVTKVMFTLVTDDSSSSLSGAPSLAKNTTISSWGSGEVGGVYTLTKTTGELISGDRLVILTFKAKSTAISGSIVNLSIKDVKYCYNDPDTLSEACVNGDGNAKSIKVEQEQIVAKSKVAALESLIISQGELSPVFDPEVENYTVEVKDTINKITVDAICSDNCSSINGNAKTSYKNQYILTKDGITSIKISVISEDTLNVKTYNINVTRGTVVNDFANLKTLIVTGGSISPSFNADILEYTISVGKEVTSLDIDYDTIHDDATVDIVGNTNLNPGENIVKINVTSSDKITTKTYIITVTKDADTDENSSSDMAVVDEETKNNNKILIIILIVFLSITVIGIAAYLIFKKKHTEIIYEEVIEEEAIPDATIDHENDADLLELTKEFDAEEVKNALENSNTAEIKPLENLNNNQ